jgi:succinate-semialdehyde dehydrogenase/glutarate-semialdehyde dehydrogenase
MSEAAAFRSVNPATEEPLATFPHASEREIATALERAEAASVAWSAMPATERCAHLCDAAAYLNAHRAELAALVTAEMGKPIAEAEAEVDKCAWGLRYFGEHAPRMLMAEVRESSATLSTVEFPPLGTVLAIMPWNFPLWQVIRFAAPALAAGNTAVLKHAANVPQCSAACAEIFRASGSPDGVFTSLHLSAQAAERLIEHPAIAAVTLTGSERAGSAVAAAAGRAIKKAVLELGGSDPFLVFADADLDAAAEAAVTSRFQNAGQSCIAAKRFIVERPVYAGFRDRFVERVKALRVGDPTDRATDMGPLARADLRESVAAQIARSAAAGARVLSGGRALERRGFFLEPAVVEGVTAEMPLWNEEVFGPAAALVEARDADEALRLANDSRYGLGANRLVRGRRTRPAHGAAHPGGAGLHQRRGGVGPALAVRRREAIGLRPGAFRVRPARVRQRADCVGRSQARTMTFKREFRARPPGSLIDGCSRCVAVPHAAEGAVTTLGQGRHLLVTAAKPHGDDQPGGAGQREAATQMPDERKGSRLGRVRVGSAAGARGRQ